MWPSEKYKRPAIFTREGCECDCADCQSMCDVPCCPSPRGAQKLIDAGLGDCLRKDYYTVTIDEEEKDFWILLVKQLPLSVKCSMQEKDGKCKLHGPIKPIEAKIATCAWKEDPLWVKHSVRRALCAFWESDEGVALLELYD